LSKEVVGQPEPVHPVLIWQDNNYDSNYY